MAGCMFCDIVSGKKEDYIVWQDENFVAFLDRCPANEGHVLLIPKEHIDYVFDMPEKLYQELFNVAKYLAEPLKRITGAEKIGIAVVGFDVPHAHLHLIPLHKSNELFDQQKFKRVASQELLRVQQQLTGSFEHIK